MKIRQDSSDFLSDDNKLAGVLTAWDVTRAVAENVCKQSVETIMTRKVISAEPTGSVLDTITDLEQNQISAMPVVDDGKVLGMVSSDLLAQRYLLRLLYVRRGIQFKCWFKIIHK